MGVVPEPRCTRLPVPFRLLVAVRHLLKLEIEMAIAKRVLSVSIASALWVSAGAAFAQKGETVKIGWVDPLSGLMAPVGQNQIKSFQFVAEVFNKIGCGTEQGSVNEPLRAERSEGRSVVWEIP